MSTPRLATILDGAVMAAIHAASFTGGEAWSAAVMRLQLELPTGFGLLHPRGGMCLARVAADDAEILTIAVAPEARRLGIGESLLRATMAEARRRGANAMFLEVAATNAPALRLYESLGFTKAGLRRRYYAGGADAVVMRAALTDPASASS